MDVLYLNRLDHLLRPSYLTVTDLHYLLLAVLLD